MLAIRPSIFPSPIKAFYGTRRAGTGIETDFAATVKKITDYLQIFPDKVIALSQIHSSTIIEISTRLLHSSPFTNFNEQSVIQISKRADGAITTLPNTLLTIKTADCVPLLLAFCPNHYPPLIAVLHCGWRGILKGFVKKGINHLLKKSFSLLEKNNTSHVKKDKYHLNPFSRKLLIPSKSTPCSFNNLALSNNLIKNNFYAAVGPSIGVNSYQVSRQLFNKFRHYFADNSKDCFKEKNNLYFLNLSAFVKNQLIKAGISENHLEVSTFDTFTEEQLFYSYRRDHTPYRQISGIMIDSY